jgi:6-pyruvoyl-tetrahydropterin synthase
MSETNIESKNGPKQVELTVFSEFKASHSLAGFEVPHLHFWRLELTFRSVLPMKSDRVLDLVALQSQVEHITSTVSGRHLNEVLPQVSPTSEMMAQWIWSEFLKQNPSAPLVSVAVTICNALGVATGAARVQ